jgi:hypothetical protein
VNRELPIRRGHSVCVFGVSVFNLYNRQNTCYKEFRVADGEITENNIQLIGRTLNASLTVKF